MVSVTPQRIQAFAPGASAPLVKAIVDNWPAAEAAGLNTPRRVQHFFAQMAAETRTLQTISESFNYSIKGLRDTFTKARISDADCERLGRLEKKVGGKKVVERAADQQAIANLLYGGKWGKDNLGNTSDGDGWAYRGSGFIQTTGRANFRACGHEDNPDNLRTPDAGFLAALVYWTDHKINAVADTGDDAAVKAVRAKINPALKGLDHAQEAFARAKTIFV